MREGVPASARAVATDSAKSAGYSSTIGAWTGAIIT